MRIPLVNMDNKEQLLQTIQDESFESLSVEEKYDLLDKAINFLQMDNPIVALEFAEMSLQLSENLLDDSKIAVICRHLFKINYHLTRYTQALEYAFKGLKISEQLNNKLHQANMYNNIAVSYYAMRDIEKAIYYNTKALEIHETLDNKIGIPMSQVNLGICYDESKQSELAENYYKKAMVQILENKDFAQLSYVYQNLGMLYVDQEKYQEAIEMFNKSLKHRRDLGDTYGEAFSLGAMGCTYFKMKENVKGLEAINKVLDIIGKYDFPDIKMNTYNCLIDYYSSIGDFQKAFDYKTKHCELHQKQITENSMRTMEKLHYLHEIEIKEKEKKEIQELYTELQLKNDLLQKTEKELMELKTQLEETVQVRTIELKEANLNLSQALNTVEKSEKMMKSILENLQDAFFQANLEGKFTFANQAAASMYGYSSPDEFIGMQAVNLYANENERSQLINDLRSSKKISNRRLQGKRKDGSTFWISMNVQFIYDNKGNITGTEGLIRDITSEKKTEEDIVKLNESLEQRVLERTKQLEESNKALEAFSHSISHDLRAPLRSMVGFSQILLEDYQPTLGAEGSRLLQVIIDNSKKMNDFINGLLKLSKITYVPLTKISIDMNSILNHVLSNLNSTCDISKVSFQLDPLLEGYGDPTLISQVWFNLICNAVKFSSKHPSPHISIKSYKNDNDIVYLIKDNGAGFNPAYQAKLFTIFNRLHSSEEYEGTGVGLSLVQRIIQKHGGTIWAESTEGKGATFYFSLPLSSP